jgi:crotonobetainyl-CoA:carnitine CoA-transferase CaiB-like acyl-CoA transferase
MITALADLWKEDTSTEQRRNTGPLAGVRVLDLTTVLMGPSATQILGDLGATVVKVESPAGDSMRWVGPNRNDGMGPLFMQANRNKRSVVLDLKTPEGHSALMTLVPEADIFVFNVRPNAMQRLGLDYESLRQANPKIIYCAAVGYGSSGCDAGKAVYDDLMQAAAGIAGLFASIDGAPRYAPVNICDRTVGLYVAIALVSALHHRTRTGEGQQIEVPMFETMAQFVLADHIGGHAFSPPIGDVGYLRLMSKVRGPYRTRDGYLSLVVYTDQHWRAFTQVLGCPQLLHDDPRFASQASRTINAEAIGAFLQEALPTRTTADWIDILVRADIPAARVNSVRDLFDNAHLRSVDFFEVAEHPTEGKVMVCRFPIQFSRSPATIRILAPNLGESGRSTNHGGETDSTKQSHSEALNRDSPS